MQTNDILCAIVKNDNSELTEMLIKSGADVNYVDKEGKFPLYYAYENNKIAQMKILISHGADINKKYGKLTILNNLCWNPKPNEEMFIFLMENEADPNISTDNNDFPLLALIAMNNIDLLIKLLSYLNTDINISNYSRSNAVKISVCPQF
jgi:ankyrin repeat protein